MDAIYARQSLDKKDSLSIEGQVELCRKYAGAEPKIFMDRGFSGKNTKRPAFTELMQAVEAGSVKKIIVYRLDRFSRSIADFSRLWVILEQHGVEFVSVTENFDTASPIGRAMLNVVMVFAQLERETTAERVKDNYRHRFALGAWPGGPAPYGFGLAKTTDESGRKVSTLVANGKAEVVKEIFTRYAESGISLRTLAKELSEKGIPGPKRECWDNVTLSRILHSPLYVMADEDIYWYCLSQGYEMKLEPEAFDGIHACNIIGRRDRSKGKYNDVPAQMMTVANHEGFVSSKVWLQAQQKLASNKQISRANAGKYSWLTGLLKCGKCGYAIKVNYSKAEDKPYLICSGRSNLSVCDAGIGFDLREVEALISEELRRVIDDCPAVELGTMSSETSVQILEIEQKIDRLVSALAESSEVSAVYISRQIERLHTEQEELLAAREHSKAGKCMLDFDKASFEEKKIIAGEFIEKILIAGNEINIVWKI